MTKATKPSRVLIAMSSGVDSSMTAHLLKEQGYDCVGVHFNMWKDPVLGHNWQNSAEAAEEVCKKIGIHFHALNLQEVFKEKIVDKFLEDYKSGKTPNPCVRCNKLIKFAYLLKLADELDCDFISTGHYLRLEKETTENGEEIVHMKKAKDLTKDQSYFLYRLDQSELSRLIFPLGEFTKVKIRQIAADAGFPELSEKAESQDICFYPEKSNRQFLERHLKEGEDFQSGDITDSQGNKLGQHRGLPFYTLGQRKGLNIGGGPALFVENFDHEKNQITVSPQKEQRKKEIHLREVNFPTGKIPSPDTQLEARIRHHGELHPAKITAQSGSTATVIFQGQGPNFPVAGQSLVLYQSDELIGGGIML
jgi:tRNA-uridine 2-sulfurtransferase